MRIDIAAQSDIGRRKKDNEDSFGVFRDDTPGLRLFRHGALLVVADGLGGIRAGDQCGNVGADAGGPRLVGSTFESGLRIVRIRPHFRGCDKE